MKENTKQKIRMFYTAAHLRKEYIPLVKLHMDWEINDIDFLIRCNSIKNNSMRKNFKSLDDVNDEVKAIFGDKGIS